MSRTIYYSSLFSAVPIVPKLLKQSGELETKPYNYIIQYPALTLVHDKMLMLATIKQIS